MYLPCLVFPYHLSPSLWNTLVSVLTQTMPLDGGGPAGADEASLEEDGFGGAAAGLLAGAGAGAEAAGAAGFALALTLARGVVVVIVVAGTPAFPRSPTEE